MTTTTNVSKLSSKEINSNKVLENIIGEKWKHIDGYINIYMVSNMGRIKSLYRLVERSNGIISSVSEKILKGWNNGDGYLFVDLKKDGLSKKTPIHKLVSDAFLPIQKSRKLINHKNYNRKDNRLKNLERVSSRENNCHRVIGKKKYSNLVGVSKVSSKGRVKVWISQITVKGKPIHLGYYHTENEAHLARVQYENDNNIENKYLYESSN